MWASNYECAEGITRPARPCRCGYRPAPHVRSPAWPATSSTRSTRSSCRFPQYRVLSLLADGSSASSALAGRLAVSPPSVTAVVDGLVARGLVERQADAGDRRRLTLLLTPAGVTLLRAAETAVDARLGEVAEYLEDPSSAAAAIEALQQWNHALDAFREEKRAK